MNNIIKFNELNEDNVIHFFSCKPFDYLNNDIKKYFNIPENIKVVGCNQTHSNRVVNLTKDNINENFDNTDGLVTALENVAIITKVADCQSILLYDPIKGIIGNIHAGWKGTLNKIILNAIDIFINEYHSNPKDILAFINPSLLKCCSEFSMNEYEIFSKDFRQFLKIKDNNKCIIDLVGINRHLLKSRGLKDENIVTSGYCNSCNNKLFHSYRKDNHTKSRNISLIYKKT